MSCNVPLLDCTRHRKRERERKSKYVSMDEIYRDRDAWTTVLHCFLGIDDKNMMEGGR
jgi:hypothetical protein